MTADVVTVEIDTSPIVVIVDESSVAMLVEVGIPGPPGAPGGGGGYAHQQVLPASVWVVNHALGRYPAVVVVDTAGDEVEGDLRYQSSSVLTLSFSAAFAGIAYLS